MKIRRPKVDQRLVAVDDVLFELRSGDVHGLIGLNGSGKTTLPNLISGYYPIDAGAIHLAGIDVPRRSAQDRARARLAGTLQTRSRCCLFRCSTTPGSAPDRT
jgi:ABC-type branched-subunit amino acid transport system ATPase component